MSAAYMKRSAPQYDEATDRLIYGNDAADIQDAQGWVRVAIAALDQAGLSLSEQRRVCDLLAEMGRAACPHGVISGRELFCSVCGPVQP